MPFDPEGFSEVVRSALLARGTSMNGFAKAHGIPVASLHAWATGTSLPSRLSIPSLATALGIPQADLEALILAERSARRDSIPAPTT